jgi:hypothetical protein
MKRLLEAHRAFHEFTDGLWDYRLFRASYGSGETSLANPQEQIRAANSRIRKMLHKYQVLETIGRLQQSQPGKTNKESFQLSPESQEDVSQLKASLATNESCLTLLELGGQCTWGGSSETGAGSFMDVELRPPSNPRGQELLAEILRMLQRYPEAELLQRQRKASEAHEKLSASIATVQRWRTSGELRSARESVIDGMLRGWPLPASTDEQAAFIDGFSEQKMPAVWTKLLARVEASVGSDLHEEGTTAGRLQRSNVFFRVQELSPGRYEVQPMYVVWETYAEVWDPRRRTVTIETPYGPPMRVAQNTQQKEVQP